MMDIYRDPNIQDTVWITGEAPGPRAVVFAGIHGDEVSGIHAIEKVLFDFFGGSRQFLRGSLAIARCNAQAIAAGRRYVKYNMNPLCRDSYGPEIDQGSYEFLRTHELKSLLGDCEYFLDLHSAPIADVPFLVAEKEALKFYRGLDIAKIMTGWKNFAGGVIGGDTENYANMRGAVSATLESGSHFEKASNDVAYAAVISFLSCLGMIEEARREPAQREPDIFEMYSVVTKEAEDFCYAGKTTNFKLLKKDEVFAYQAGKPLTVAEESYLLIPMQPEKTKIQEEVCYLGRKL